MARIIGTLLSCGIIILCCAATVRGQWQDSTIQDEFLDFRDVSFVDETTGYLAGWARTFDGVDIWAEGRTTDGGDLWLWQSGVLLEETALHFHDLNHGFMVGRSPECHCPIVVYTSDGLATTPNYEFEELDGKFTSLASSDALHAFFAGGNPITGEGFVARTTDGGETFSIIMRQQNAYVANIIQLDEKTLIISLGTGTENGNILWKSTNADAEPDAVEWGLLHTFEEGGGVTELNFTDAEVGYATFARFNNPDVVGEIYKTTNGGADWERLYSSGEFTPEGVDFFDRDNGFVVGSGGMILQTTDGGKKWSDTVPGTTSRLLAVHYVTPAFAYAVGEAGAMLRYVMNSSAVREEDPARDDGEGEYVQALSGDAEGRLLLVQTSFPAPSGSRLVVFDLLGNSVKEISLPGPGATMHVDGLNPGSYFFMVVADKRILQRGRSLVR